MKSPSFFIWVALVLLVAWVVLRVALAVTGFALHLLWIGAIISLVVWIVGKFKGGGSTSP